MLGNIPGLDILTKGGPEAVYAETLRRLDAYGCKRGLILSAGGGASPGMPRENVLSFMSALGEWNAATRR
jgi:uroporphyrinogen decarboxylase